MRVGLLSNPAGPFLGYVLKALNRRRIPIDCIILDSKVPGPRNDEIHQERTGGRLPPIPLASFEEQFIPCFLVESHASEVTARLVRERELDLLVNAGTPRILPGTTLDAPRVGVLNCHPGLLPRYRGCTCVEWAIFTDEPLGNTVHFMSEGIDEGPIVVQEALTFRKEDDYVDVRLKVYNRGFDLMAAGVEKVIREGLSPESMAPQGEGRYWRVIEEDKMQEVVRKLAEGRYRYQL